MQGVDFERRFGARRQRPFGPLAGRPQSSESSRVATDVFFAFPLELLDEMSHQSVVKVFTAQVRIAGRRLNFEQRTLVDGQYRHVERTAAQIEYQHILLSLQVLVETVGQGCRRGLVDYSQHVKSGNGSSVFGSLSLRIVEVRRYSDYSVSDLVQ